MGGARGSPFLSVEILESSVQQSYQVMTEEYYFCGNLSKINKFVHM